MAKRKVWVAPPNTLIVRATGDEWLEQDGFGGLEEVNSYTVLAANIDPECETLTYDMLPVPANIGGQYTESINAAVAHLPRTRTRRASHMSMVTDSELEELRARGVNVIIEPMQ